MTQIKSFFELVKTPGTLVQIGTLQQVQPIESAEADAFVRINKDKDLYFLGGISSQIKDQNHRAQDDDIVEKTYIAFDFDIRKDLGNCSDETLEEAMGLVLAAFRENEDLKDYGAAVCSGNGLHVYYFSEMPLQLKGKKAAYNIGYDRMCTVIEATIRAYFVWNTIDLPVFCPDRACKNVARIMRVPTSWNHKNGTQKPVRFIEFSGKYSQLAFNLLESGRLTIQSQDFESSPVANHYKPKLTTNLESLAGLTRWEQLRKIDNKYMLERLSGSYLVNHEKYRFERRGGSGGWLIYLQGSTQPMNAWIDADGYIGSAGIHGRTWVEWVMNWPDFKRSAKELLQWTDKYLPLPEAAKGRMTNIVLSTPKEIIGNSGTIFSSYKSRFFWLTQKIDNEMPVFMPGDYVLVAGESGVGKTTLAMHFALENARRGRRVVYFSLEQMPKTLLENYFMGLVGVTEQMQKDDMVTEEHNKQALALLNDLPPTFLFPHLPHALTTLTSADIINTVRMYDDVELIVIDNLGFLRQPEHDEEWKELKELNRALVQLAHDPQRPVGIFALHHFTKGAGNDKGPKSNDLIRGSRKLIDDADVVMQVVKHDTSELVGDLKNEMEKKRTIFVTKDRRHGRNRAADYYLHNGKMFDTYQGVDSNEVNF